MATKEVEKDLFEDIENVEMPDDLREGFIAEIDPASKLESEKEKIASEDAPDILKENVRGQVTSIGRKTAEDLAENYEKVKMMVPIDRLHPDDEFVVVAINGRIFQIKRGKAVMVPEPIYNIALESGLNPTIVR